MLIDALVAVGEAHSHQNVDRDDLLLALGGIEAHDPVSIERGAAGEARLDVTPLIFGSLDLLMWLARTLPISQESRPSTSSPTSARSSPTGSRTLDLSRIQPLTRGTAKPAALVPRQRGR